MPKPDMHVWLHHWQDEADAAYLYLALAGQEADPHKKDVYIKLAGVEERHVQMWGKLLAEHGHTVEHARLSLNARSGLVGRLWHAAVVAAVAPRRRREVKGYLDSQA
jgi:hypothetical protein